MCSQKDEESRTIKLSEKLKILPGGMVELSFSLEQCLALGEGLLKLAEQAEEPAAEAYKLFSLLFRGAGTAAAATRQMTPAVLAEWESELAEQKSELERVLAGRAKRLLGPEAENAQ